MATVDATRAPLLEVAVDVTEGSLPLDPVAIRDHPAHSRFLSSLEGDPLAQLFPADGQGFASLSTGSGTLLDRDSLLWTLLASSLQRLRLCNELADRHSYLQAVAEDLDVLRCLARGETALLRGLIGFAGIGIEPGVRLQLPWGRLSAASPDARKVVSGPSAKFTLTGRVAARLLVTPAGIKPGNTPLRRAERDQIEDLENKTILALLLGLPSGKPAASPLWRVVISPWHAKGWGAAGGLQPTLFGEQAFIDRSTVVPLTRTALMIERHYEPRITPAVRRAVASVAARLDPSDGLIDAVIALESLFSGTDKSELRFRIAAAVAWLLEPDNPKRREACFAEARRLYDARSRIVHGQGIPSDPHALRDQAFSLVVRSLRRLYARFPDLLADDQRSAKIILHTSGPPK